MGETLKGPNTTEYFFVLDVRPGQDVKRPNTTEYAIHDGERVARGSKSRRDILRPPSKTRFLNFISKGAPDVSSE